MSISKRSKPNHSSRVHISPRLSPGVRFGLNNDIFHDKSMQKEDDEVEFSNRIQDHGSNSELADTTE